MQENVIFAGYWMVKAKSLGAVCVGRYNITNAQEEKLGRRDMNIVTSVYPS